MNYRLQILMGLQIYELCVPNINGFANFYELWTANKIGLATFRNYGLQKTFINYGMQILMGRLFFNYRLQTLMVPQTL